MRLGGLQSQQIAAGRAPELAGKQMELLKEIRPKISRVASSGIGQFAEGGGLLAYGPSLADGYRWAPE